MKTTLLLTSLLLTGCANGLPELSTSTTKQTQSVEKIFVGVPFLMGLEGSSVRLDDNWMVTAAHNKSILKAQLKEVYYHETCDIALYRSQGTSTTKVGKVYENETLTTIGYPVGLPLASTQGNYVGEIDVDNWDCTMSASTNVTMGGMSGGGVFNDKGELVGVVHGFISGDVVWSSKSVKSPSVFLSLYAVKGWLTEMTGVEYFL